VTRATRNRACAGRESKANSRRAGVDGAHCKREPGGAASSTTLLQSAVYERHAKARNLPTGTRSSSTSTRLRDFHGARPSRSSVVTKKQDSWATSIPRNRRGTERSPGARPRARLHRLEPGQSIFLRCLRHRPPRSIGKPSGSITTRQNSRSATSSAVAEMAQRPLSRATQFVGHRRRCRNAIVPIAPLARKASALRVTTRLDWSGSIFSTGHEQLNTIEHRLFEDARSGSLPELARAARS